MDISVNVMMHRNKTLTLDTILNLKTTTLVSGKQPKIPPNMGISGVRLMPESLLIMTQYHPIWIYSELRWCIEAKRRGCCHFDKTNHFKRFVIWLWSYPMADSSCICRLLTHRKESIKLERSNSTIPHLNYVEATYINQSRYSFK